MWLSTTKMDSYQCFLVVKPSRLSNCMIAGLGLIVVAAVGSFCLGYIYTLFTSMFLIVSTVYFTLFSTQHPKECKPNCKKEEDDEGYSEQVADKGVLQTHEQIPGQEGCRSMHRALNYLTTISENESTGDDDDGHCITTSEDDEDGFDQNHVARSSLSSEDDGSISDEDTLIEIELPTGHYLSSKELQKRKLNSKQKLPDYYQTQCTQQDQRWMELLSDVNNELATEEDNFIEIDISIGSIMCPRFEIQA